MSYIFNVKYQFDINHHISVYFGSYYYAQKMQLYPFHKIEDVQKIDIP